MKILVAYFSETGNTKRIAEAIQEAADAQGHVTSLLTVGEVKADDLPSHDAVFLGSTCHSSDIAAPVRSLLDGIPSNLPTKLAGFVTHAAMMPEGEDWQKAMYEKWAGQCEGTFRAACETKGLDFLGFFHCQGVPSPQIEAFIHSTILTDETQWNRYIEAIRPHPTSEDLDHVKSFARDVLAKL